MSALTPTPCTTTVLAAVPCLQACRLHTGTERGIIIIVPTNPSSIHSLANYFIQQRPATPINNNNSRNTSHPTTTTQHIAS
jgi:hypothetical protein